MSEFQPYAQPGEHVLGRPQDIIAEQHLLGALIQRPDLYDEVFEIVDGRDFYNAWNREAWYAIIDLVNEGVTIDQASITRRLERVTQWDNPREITAFVEQLIYAAYTPSNAKFYASIVAGDGMRRRICETAPMLSVTANNYGMTADEVRESIHAQIAAAVDHLDNETVSAHASDLAVDIADRILSDAKQGKRSHGAMTGLTLLDYVTSGLNPGDLYLIAARTSVGKSALALRIVESFCKRDEKVVYFSLEMSKEDLFERLYSMHTRIPFSSIRNRDLSAVQQVQIEHAKSILKHWDLQIDEKPGVTPQYVRNRSRVYSRRRAIDLIVVDHLHIMEASSKTNEEVKDLGKITIDLHNLARDLRVPVLALCQLNRGPENRPDPVPTLRDIRGSGAIEENADTILGVHRPDYRKMRDTNYALPAIEEAELHVLKNRNGPTGGMVKVAYMSNCVRFDNLGGGAAETRPPSTTAQQPIATSTSDYDTTLYDEDPFGPEDDAPGTRPPYSEEASA